MPKRPASIIAIDGPAASGKSTLGLRLAERLGYMFFDTGVMYRAVTWMAMSTGVDIQDENAIAELARKIDIDVRSASVQDGRACDVLVDGRDVTWETRSGAVDANVSVVAAYPGVRLAMRDHQRHIGQRGRVVMVGRDIGTVILPDADLKIYLDASTAERARRRHQELLQRGVKADPAEVLAIVRERDRIDSTRDMAPLSAAEDALRINSDGLTADQTFEEVLKLCE